MSKPVESMSDPATLRALAEKLEKQAVWQEIPKVLREAAASLETLRKEREEVAIRHEVAVDRAFVAEERAEAAEDARDKALRQVEELRQVASRACQTLLATRASQESNG